MGVSLNSLFKSKWVNWRAYALGFKECVSNTQRKESNFYKTVQSTYISANIEGSCETKVDLHIGKVIIGQVYKKLVDR
jgi:hypothetical protein